MVVSIVGYGTVGSRLASLFGGANIHDPAKGHADPVDGIAFVCVPTPAALDGSADTSIVESVIHDHSPELFVIRSTVPPGTCRALAARYGKAIVFQPEYLGMTPGHRFGSDADVPFVILGGPRGDTERVADLYRRVLSPDMIYRHTTWETAELAKYATNTFLAAKVEFANELYDAAQAADVDYEELRELWLLDPRIGRSHTAVDPRNRGYDGACFPKDVAAFVAWGLQVGIPLPVLRAADAANRLRR